MLERLHEHIVSELGHSSRTDTIFVIAAILFDLIVLGINSGVASEAQNNPGAENDVLLVVFIFMAILVNSIALIALSVGRGTRNKLQDGLIAMYRDNAVDQYYDASLIKNYRTRYTLFGAVILVLGLTAILAPLIIRFL
jgi:hypothetical protein